MKPIFYGTSTDGKFIPDNPYDYRKAFLSFEGKEIEVTVDKKRKARSNQQNRYYFGVPIKLISEHTGHSPDEVHELLKAMFLKKYLEIETKEGVQRFSVVKSTTSISTVEMEEYLSSIRMWASMDLGVFVPDPNEVEI